MTRLPLLLVATASLCAGALVYPTTDSDNFELLILHNNDMHARFEQTSQLSGACTTADREAGKCYGGFPRVAHVVKEARKAAQNGQGPPVLYLNAGDTYTGTAWFTIYKWKIAAEFINALQPDAVSLGNNDIEKGPSKMSPFINEINTKILASNVILKTEDNQNVQKSIIFDINGVKVGVIGYLTPEAKVLDSAGDLEYNDEVIAVKEEVEKLKAIDVKIIIALGHSTLSKDIEIAKEVEGLDLVIAGQKNKFFWDGTTVEYAVKDVIVTQASGKKVPVIQSSSYNKYLGRLTAKFDQDGEIIDYNVSPILLDDSITQDIEAVKIVNNHQSELSARSEEVVGTTAVVLDGSSCKTEECNLGNLIADAITYYYASNYEGDVVWTGAPLAVIPSGFISSSIAPENRPASITRGDLLQVLPQESHLVVATLSGTILLQVLEHSVANFNINNPTGELLQFSGIRAVYDLSKEPGSRLVDAVVRCGSCFVPEYYIIDDWRMYYVLMPASLTTGEYGYSMLQGVQTVSLSYDELTCTAEYIKLRSPVYPEIAERIVLNNIQEDDTNTVPTTEATTETTTDTTTEATTEATPTPTDEPDEDDDDDEDGSGAAGHTAITTIVFALFFISLGNHEFDEAVDGLVPFIRNLSTPVLAANLILDKVPELQAEKNLLPSIVLVKNNIKIGIIGYLTGETKYLAPKNDVEYEDEVTALKREVKKLRREGVTLFIALGHSGFVKDLEIAKYVDGIDLVIGGHSNTFLWNMHTTKEKPEIPQGPYPVEIRQKSGKIVRVVQAYAYTKYLGRLHLTIDRFGNIIHCDGTPILLDESVPRDPEVLKMVEKYRSDIDRLNNVIVGTSLSTLHGEYCRLRECNIGVLITEAMINYTRATYADPEDINIAIIQGGRIRTSIEHPEKPFNLTRGDLVTVLPFTDPVVLVSMNGSILRQCLEHAIDGWRIVDSPGQFLQFTGINITYDLARPPGHRIVSAKAVCLDCGKQLVDINDHFQYKLLMSEFLADGGDGYAMFERLDREIMSFNEVDCLIYYLARSGPVNLGYSGRITVLNQDKVEKIQADFRMTDISSSKAKTASSLVLLVSLAILCLNL